MSNSSSQTRLLTTAELPLAAELLRGGNLVAFPTDTFFALGAILTEAAVGKLFEVKGRMAGNPVPVLISSADQVDAVAQEFPQEAQKLAREFWPGPLTLVLPAKVAVPGTVTANTMTVGVRIPSHRLAIDFITLVGAPVTGTSANISGLQPCKSATEVMDQLGGKIAAVVDASCGDHVAPSTVVRFTDSGFIVVRVGALSENQLQRALNAD